jgi:YD repeat-containing protein
VLPFWDDERPHKNRKEKVSTQIIGTRKNRLISITANSQTTQFIYNGDGNMVKKINPDGSSTTYIGAVYEEDKDTEGTVTGITTYYPAAGAMRVDGRKDGKT